MTLVAEEMSGRLEVIDAELGDVRKRLEKLYEAIETSELTPKRSRRPASCRYCR